jgi:plasmid stabilization system protein ParE
MAAKYNVTVFENARIMLLEHVDFLAQISIEAAVRLMSQFDRAIERIGDNPFQFPVADNMDAPDLPPNAYRRCLFEKRYKALFIVEGGDVFVDAVIDSRMENNDL